MIVTMILIGLVKLLLVTNKPFVCAGIYTFTVLLFMLLLGCGFETIFFRSVIAFTISSIYFWLLKRLQDFGATWWMVAIGGVIILRLV